MENKRNCTMKTQINRRCLAISIAASFALFAAGATLANTTELSKQQSLTSKPVKLAVRKTILAPYTKPIQVNNRKKEKKDKIGNMRDTYRDINRYKH